MFTTVLNENVIIFSPLDIRVLLRSDISRKIWKIFWLYTGPVSLIITVEISSDPACPCQVSQDL